MRIPTLFRQTTSESSTQTWPQPRVAPARVDRQALDRAIEQAANALMTAQASDGFWRFDLEADASITAEYVLMMHFMDEIDAGCRNSSSSIYERRRRRHGGWGLFPGSAMDLSCSVKAYYAFKLAGDDPSAPHMERARTAILDAWRCRSSQRVHADDVSPCSGRSRGAVCRSCQSRSCSCRGGSRSTCRRSPTGRAR